MVSKKIFHKIQPTKEKVSLHKKLTSQKTQKCCHKCKQGNLDVTTYQLRFYKKRSGLCLSEAYEDKLKAERENNLKRQTQRTTTP